MLTAANELPNTVSTHLWTAAAAGCMMYALHVLTDALFISCRKLTSVKALYIDERVENCTTKKFTATGTRFTVGAAVVRHCGNLRVNIRKQGMNN
jgi:hypothetical protein